MGILLLSPIDIMIRKKPMNKKSVSELITEKQAVIFDLFYTLISVGFASSYRPLTFEILGVGREQWNTQLLEKSRDRLTGKEKDPSTIVEKMARAIDPAIPDELIAKATTNRLKLFERAMVEVPKTTNRVLSRLKGAKKKIGLVSNADVTEIAGWKKSPLSGHFDSVVFSCEVGYVKPEREIYKLCLRELQTHSDECVFVGDGGSQELEGARSLGLTTVMFTGIIRNVWPEKIEERRKFADFVIDGLDELLGEVT